MENLTGFASSVVSQTGLAGNGIRFRTSFYVHSAVVPCRYTRIGHFYRCKAIAVSDDAACVSRTTFGDVWTDMELLSEIWCPGQYPLTVAVSRHAIQTKEVRLLKIARQDGLVIFACPMQKCNIFGEKNYAGRNWYSNCAWICGSCSWFAE